MSHFIKIHFTNFYDQDFPDGMGIIHLKEVLLSHNIPAHIYRGKHGPVIRVHKGSLTVDDDFNNNGLVYTWYPDGL